jgi:Fe-S cluster biogenesis protein NfuA
MSSQPSDHEELINKVRNVIEQIRPYLQADGGDIQFINLSEDNVVNVELHGACGTCPYSRVTLKNGVEEAVKRVLPEIKAVEAMEAN